MYSESAGGRSGRILTCRNKADGGGRMWVVDNNGRCENFTRDKELLAPDLVWALAEGAKLIPLTQDKFAIVDSEDYDELSGYKWHVSKGGRTDYGKRLSLGYFDDEIAAAKAYDKKAFELFGEFAYLNFPDELWQMTDGSGRFSNIWSAGRSLFMLR